MKLKKSQVFIGDIYMQTELEPMVEHGQQKAFLMKKDVFLVKFGLISYVPLQDIKNSLHFLTLQHKVKSNGIAKYAREFLAEGPTYRQCLWLSIKNIHPAFNPEKANEKVDVMKLKKFERYANKKENCLTQSKENLEK